LSEVGRSAEVVITGYSHDGRGVGRLSGQVVFVPGTVKGERIRLEVVREQRGILTGRLLEVIDPAMERLIPDCPVFFACGGCQLQHLNYQAQLELKRDIVTDALRRIGGFRELTVQPVLGMDKPWGYRNKGHFKVEKNGAVISLGFYEEGSHNLVNQSCTHLFSAKVGELLQGLTDILNRTGFPVEEEGSPGLRQIMIRESKARDEILLVFILSGQVPPHLKEITREICHNYPNVGGVCANINPRKGGPILGEKTEIISGKGEIEDQIGPFSFAVSPHSFFQVNNIQTEVLYAKAVEYAGLTGQELALDAYCGIGTISLFLAQKAKQVVGIEIVPEAIRDAVANARRNKVSNVEFIQGQAERVMPALVKKGLKPQVVVVDPPRKGCGQPLLDSILQVKPQRVVYVSCNPATLARDLKYLAAGGYEVKEVQPVDMFPQTAHTECCCLMIQPTNAVNIRGDL